MHKLLPALAFALAASLAPALGHAAPATAAPQPLVSTDWLKDHLQDSRVVVLDLRPTAQYGVGHIPHSVSADYEHSGWRAVLPSGAKGALPPIADIAATIGRFGVGDASHAIIVGDNFGAAARIYWTLKVLGHRDVSVLDGGWKGWAANPADPIDTAPVTPVATTFTAAYDPGLRAELPDVAQAIATGDATLVDARPPQQWTGASKTPDVAEYGHLPHAVWIDQTDALRSDGRLKPTGELAQLFGGLGAKPVTTYCNTGHLAATDWFVLSEVLHRPGTKLYDGSLSEWTADPSRPIVREPDARETTAAR